MNYRNLLLVVHSENKNTSQFSQITFKIGVGDQKNYWRGCWPLPLKSSWNTVPCYGLTQATQHLYNHHFLGYLWPEHIYLHPGKQDFSTLISVKISVNDWQIILPHTTFPAGVTRPSSLTFTWNCNVQRNKQQILVMLHITVILYIRKKKKEVRNISNAYIIVSMKNINTSIIVPLVMTPREVYIGPLGFFLTPIISRLNVHLSSGCVTWALVNRSPVGRMNRSYFGGFLVKPGPTNVAFVTILFHCLAEKWRATNYQVFF